ncbi:MAG: hypothetical protein ACLTSG_08565 [Lachnospiraceae bacterium]
MPATWPRGICEEDADNHLVKVTERTYTEKIWRGRAVHRGSAA